MKRLGAELAIELLASYTTDNLVQYGLPPKVTSFGNAALRTLAAVGIAGGMYVLKQAVLESLGISDDKSIDPTKP